jgi:hypothetical protein
MPIPALLGQNLAWAILRRAPGPCVPQRLTIAHSERIEESRADAQSDDKREDQGHWGVRLAACGKGGVASEIGVVRRDVGRLRCAR